MNLLPGITPTASALDAEKVRMNIISQNIANAFTTRDVNGLPYKRKMVNFESVMASQQPGGSNQARLQSVRVRTILEDQSPGQMIYNPQHPDSNADGYVEMPNVEMTREMVDLIASSRAYEANLQVARTARTMAQKALAIGRK